MHSLTRFSFLLTFPIIAACGGDEPCDVIAQEGCEAGLVCENIPGSEPACFAPVVVVGKVFELGTGDAIPGARVVALDVNRSPVSAVAITGADGSYALTLPSDRDENGAPAALDITLRADAGGYQSFPGGVRQALPIDTSIATDNGERWVVESPLTDIGLIVTEGGGTSSIHGTVEVPAARTGVLVVAEGPDVGSALADSSGDYEIFNLEAGSYAVKAYAVGANYEPAAVDLGEAARQQADLAIAAEATASFLGGVNLVNPGDGSGTSVILVVESTFNEGLVRGEAVPGLRVPPPGEPPNATGAFTMEGVPDGRYVVLASFENDFLVRDPDSCQGGTALVHIEVAGADVDLSSEAFKVTGALDVLSPGATGAEEITGTPTFVWVDDSGEDQYDVWVVDSFGETIWQTEIAGVSGGNPMVEYAGPALETGMYYQFRALSSNTTGGGTRCEKSQTEDLKGVFVVR